jgi:hypothetical protein
VAVSTLTKLQGGSFNRSTGTWTAEVADQASLGGAAERWIQFDHASILEQKGGPLVTAATVTLTPSAWAGSPETGTLSLYAVQMPVRAAFSTGNPPSPRSAAFGALSTTLTNAAASVLTVPLSTAPVGGQGASVPSPIDHQLVSRNPDSADAAIFRTALGLTWSGTGGDIAVASFNVTHQQGLTGLVGHHEAYGRADECPKCGGKSVRDEWVRDAWTDLMVCHRCYDPDDPLGKRRSSRGEQAPVNEG